MRCTMAAQRTPRTVPAGCVAEAGGVAGKQEVVRMSEKLQNALTDEPVGIVISRGSREEVAPRFRAYLWLEDPDPENDEGVATDCRAA